MLRCQSRGLKSERLKKSASVASGALAGHRRGTLSDEVGHLKRGCALKALSFFEGGDAWGLSHGASAKHSNPHTCHSAWAAPEWGRH